jgi:general secretion pathway protein J
MKYPMGTCANRRTPSISGLTMIEVMVAVAVLSMISIAIWTGMSQTSRTRDVVMESHGRLHEVRVAMDFLTRDLTSAFLSSHRATVDPVHDTVFIGEDHGSEDQLDFASFTHQRRYLDVDESDQCEVGYFLEDDPEKRDVKNLIRRESPVLDDKALEGGQYLIVLGNVVEFDLEYFDLALNEWQPEWDTTDNVAGEIVKLPQQVRVKLVVHDRRGNEVTYGTQFPIPMKTPIFRAGGFVPGPPILEAR